MELEIVQMGLANFENATKENEVIYKTLKQIHDFPMNLQDICLSSLLNAVDNKVSATNMSVKEFKQEGINWLKTISTVSFHCRNRKCHR